MPTLVMVHAADTIAAMVMTEMAYVTAASRVR